MVQPAGHISILLALMMTLLLTKTVIGTYQPAYLKTNLVGKNPSTNTLRVIQEQTEALAFEWKSITHNSLKYVYLIQPTSYFQQTVEYIYTGDIGKLPTIGKPCEATPYEARGYYSWGLGFSSLFITYAIEYERVPRIENVRIQKHSGSSSRMTWGREKSPCESNTTIIFRGYSTHTLEMFVIPRNEVEYYVDHAKLKERRAEVFILFNKHGDRFSLPTIDELLDKKVNEERSTIQTESASVTVGIKEETATLNTSINVTVGIKEDATTLNTYSIACLSVTAEILCTLLVSTSHPQHQVFYIHQFSKILVLQISLYQYWLW
uniref:Uncharacterized protein n=1 Tax=Schistosoma mansoni TaxID=6183 RepID=A0A3Q0KS82_SCHMA